jgi:hypothetical protein
MFNRDTIKHVCFQQRVPLEYLLREQESLRYSIFDVKHCKERKERILALNFRLAVNMVQLIYALKNHNN